jgi:hypothetical protein
MTVALIIDTMKVDYVYFRSVKLSLVYGLSINDSCLALDKLLQITLVFIVNNIFKSLINIVKHFNVQELKGTVPRKSV